MAVRRFHPFLRPVLAVTLAALPVGATAFAQSASPAAGDSKSKDAAPSQHKFNPTGSPLDTLLSTRIWADVPPAENFVKESRPDPRTLEYKPLTGTDPVRPKPRDPNGVAALQAELEAGIAKNAARAKPLQGVAAKNTLDKKVAAKARKKTKPGVD